VYIIHIDVNYVYTLISKFNTLNIVNNQPNFNNNLNPNEIHKFINQLRLLSINIIFNIIINYICKTKV